MWSDKTLTERIAIRRMLVEIHNAIVKISEAAEEVPAPVRDQAERAAGFCRVGINTLGLGRIEPEATLEDEPCE